MNYEGLQGSGLDILYGTSQHHTWF